MNLSPSAPETDRMIQEMVDIRNEMKFRIDVAISTFAKGISSTIQELRKEHKDVCLRIEALEQKVFKGRHPVNGPSRDQLIAELKKKIPGITDIADEHVKHHPTNCLKNAPEAASPEDKKLVNNAKKNFGLFRSKVAQHMSILQSDEDGEDEVPVKECFDKLKSYRPALLKMLHNARGKSNTRAARSLDIDEEMIREVETADRVLL